MAVTLPFTVRCNFHPFVRVPHLCSISEMASASNRDEPTLLMRSVMVFILSGLVIENPLSLWKVTVQPSGSVVM